MAERDVIPSVNQGIRAAVEEFVKAHRLREYRRGIRAAAGDESFLQRTLDAQSAFTFADAEVDPPW
jgi:hypothetical protein